MFDSGQDVVERYNLQGMEKTYTPELFGIYKLYKAINPRKIPGFIDPMVQKIFDGSFKGDDQSARQFLNSACNFYYNVCYELDFATKEGELVC